MSISNQSGLYFITDSRKKDLDTCLFLVEQAIQGGAQIIQLREKNLSTRAFYEKAKALHQQTKAYGIPLIINDRLDIAMAVGADGVHLGQSDMPIPVARRLLGKKSIIGATCHCLEEALVAEAEGADYLGLGAVFSTSTKTDTHPIEKETIREIRSQIDLPIFLIGGIHPSNLHQLVDTGADGFCCISAISQSEDPKEQAKKLCQIWNHHR